MPVQVPTEPKKYTTVYDNFKGVDYTSDPSNVFRRRSPSGLNMLPDLDGRPHKRTGWGIRFSADDFNAVAGTTGEVTPNKTSYFSYGSTDYLMIFNDKGVFWTSSEDDINGAATDTLHLAELAVGTSESHTVSDFPPAVGGENLPADPQRAFFFEGNGVAGFYVFVGNTLFRFGADDNGDMYFWEVTPYVPRVLIGCNADGIGTAFEGFNMLTDKRTIEYFGDGTSTEYKLPSIPDPDTVHAYILNLNGRWVEILKTDPNYPWELSGAFTIRFTGTYKPRKSTVGNFRVTYEPAAKSTYTTTPNTKTDVKTLKDTIFVGSVKEITVNQDQVWNASRKKWVNKGKPRESAGPWVRMEFAYEENVSTSLKTPNVYDRSTLKVYANYSGSYQQVSPKVTWGAYSSSINVAFPNNSVAKTLPVKTKIYARKKISSYVSLEDIETSYTGAITSRTRTVTTIYQQRKEDVQEKTFNVYATYTSYAVQNTDKSAQSTREAFTKCSKALTFGNNIYNQVFLSACSEKNYRNRAWYCAANDPSYWSDTNYIEVGADDKMVMGLIKIGQYLGIVKKGSGTDASVYLAYPTSFDEQTTFAVKQSVSGIGAISNGAFNILNEEPLFLSERGIMGVDVSEDNPDKQIRNRSHYINKRLLQEPDLSGAISFVHDGMYYLGVGDRCYVLDGAQKTSWANEKTNLQYECYYLENVPAQCFAKLDNLLYFTDYSGNLCRFKTEGEEDAYVDEYGTSYTWTSEVAPVDEKFELSFLVGEDTIAFNLMDENADYLVDKADDYGLMVKAGLPDPGEVVYCDGKYYTVTELEGDPAQYACVVEGVAIKSEWATIADDDEMVHYFKNLTKKGCVVSLLPEGSSAVDIYLRADEREPIHFGRMSVSGTFLPSDVYVKKKIKKYKRLQIICQNNEIGEGFALDQIIKTYTVGNYSKNRG